MTAISAKSSPSPQWTDEERIRVVVEFMDAVMGIAQEGHAVWPNLAYDIAERVILILTQHRSFLETNRKSILEGQVRQ